MAFFVLDLNNMESNIDSFNDKILDLKDELGITYDRLMNIDSCWNGISSSEFIEIVKSDGYKIDEYLDGLCYLYNELSVFINGIRKVCKKSGYRDVYNIRFDDSRVSDCLAHLNFIVEILNKCVYKMGSSSEKADRLLEVIQMVNDYKDNLFTFKTNINNFLSENRNKVGKNDVNQLNIPLIKYNNK